MRLRFHFRGRKSFKSRPLTDYPMNPFVPPEKTIPPRWELRADGTAAFEFLRIAVTAAKIADPARARGGAREIPRLIRYSKASISTFSGHGYATVEAMES